MKRLNITERRYPRSLADAFPSERAEWCDPYRPGVSGVFRWLGAGLGVLAALMLFVHLFLSLIGA